MRRTRFNEADCPIARTVDLLGDWWTPLVLREFFLGRRRFDELTDALGISRAVLSTRLKRLEEEGVIERHQYQDRPKRSEYQLTEMGRDLGPVLMSMWNFGTAHLYGEDERPPSLRMAIAASSAGRAEDAEA